MARGTGTGEGNLHYDIEVPATGNLRTNQPMQPSCGLGRGKFGGRQLSARFKRPGPFFGDRLRIIDGARLSAYSVRRRRHFIERFRTDVTKLDRGSIRPVERASSQPTSQNRLIGVFSSQLLHLSTSPPLNSSTAEQCPSGSTSQLLNCSTTQHLHLRFHHFAHELPKSSSRVPAERFADFVCATNQTGRFGRSFE